MNSTLFALPSSPLDDLRTILPNVLYRTEPMKLGRHWWRCVVFEHPHYGRCTHYEWVPADESVPFRRWMASFEWRGYERNHNDSNGGLPAGLRKLYDANKAAITAALGGAQ